MIFKKILLSKILANGLKADFCLMRDEDTFQAALFIDGKRIPGPSLPVPLDPANDTVTHWMGNRPSVGLTSAEAEKIIKAVALENGVLEHRKLF